MQTANKARQPSQKEVCPNPLLVPAPAMLPHLRSHLSFRQTGAGISSHIQLARTHGRNLCLGAFMLGVGVYQGGGMGVVLGVIGGVLMLQSWMLLK